MPLAARPLPDGRSPSANLQGRGVTRLCHFTPLSNLETIVGHGLLSRAFLQEKKLPHLFTDPLRLDRHLDKTSVSVQYPNSWFLSQLLAKTCVPFVVLTLDPTIVDQPGTLSSPVNAASRAAPLELASTAIDSLFAKSSPHTSQADRSEQRAPSVPTCLQAELLIPGRIPSRAIKALLASEIATAEVARSSFDGPIFIAPDIFTASLESLLHEGKRVPETVFTQRPLF